MIVNFKGKIFEHKESDNDNDIQVLRRDTSDTPEQRGLKNSKAKN